MPNKFTLKITATPNPEKQNFIDEAFFSKGEREELANLQSFLNNSRKAPSETSLRIIREHSIRTSHLLEA